MKNLLLTLVVAPLMCLMQANAQDLQLIEVDPADVIVHDGLFVEQQGVVLPVKSLLVRNHKVLALLSEEEPQELSQNGWIFMFPPDAEKYFRGPMSCVGADECNCGCDFISDVVEDDVAEFIEAKGLLNSWLKDSFRKGSDRSFPIQTNGGCNCKKNKERYFVNQKTGDIIVSIHIEDDEYSQEEDELQTIRVYIEDEEVAEILLDLENDENAAIIQDMLDELYDLMEQSEEDFEEDLVIGYDAKGAFYHQPKPTSFYQLPNHSKN